MNYVLNSKLKQQISQIVSVDISDTIARRLRWIEMHKAREDFLQSLRTKGLKGKDYSDEVVKYDKVNRLKV